MRYENLVTRSARIVWRNPWLWLLAFLAWETSSGGGGGNSSSSFTGPRGGQNAALPDLGWVPGWIQDRAALLVEVAAVLLLVWLLLFLVSCVASGALVAAVAAIDAGEKPGFGRAWGMGMRTFWRVLGFKLVQLLLSLGGLLLLLLPPLAGAFGWGTPGLFKGLLLDLPLFFAVLFWVALVGWLALLGLRALVLEGRGPLSAYGAGWALLKRRFPRIALTAVVLGLVGFGVGIAVQLVLALVSAPFAGLLFADFLNGRWSQLAGTLAVFLVVLVPVSAILSSLGGAYFATAWTVAYRRFDLEGEAPEPVPLA